jgi:ABC-type polysaccharide/polyol phosphate export permease
VLIRNRLPDPMAFGFVAVFSLLFFAVSWIVFHRAEFQFAENV